MREVMDIETVRYKNGLLAPRMFKGINTKLIL